MASRIHAHRRTDRGGGWSWTLFGIALGMLPCLASAEPEPSQTKQPAAKAPSAARAQRTAKKSSAAQDEAKEVADVVSTFEASDNAAFLPAFNALANKLHQAGPESDNLARQLLARRKIFVTDADLAALRNATGKCKPVVAAQLLLQVARARNTVRTYQRGHVVVGRLIVEDGKTDSELVLAQMPILPEGYFVGEVADLQRKICFRAQGYLALDVPLDGKKGDVVSVGEVRLKPLPEAEQATMRGTVELDGEGAATTAKAQIHLQVGPINTPHNGYSPRGRWPAPIMAPIGPRIAARWC